MISQTIDPDELATEFCRVLHVWLGPEILQEINRRNELPDYANCCASHDFCDANQAMADALETLGSEFHPDLCEIINTAWDYAKQRSFSIDRA